MHQDHSGPANLIADFIAKQEIVVNGVWHACIPCMYFDKKGHHMRHQAGTDCDGIASSLQQPC